MKISPRDDVTSKNSAILPGESLAGFGQRCIGAIVDIIIFAVLFVIVGTLLAPAIGPKFAGAYFFLALAGGFAYVAPFWVTSGITPGKLLVGTKVVDASGSRITIRSALVRYAGYWLNWITLGLGFAYAAMNPARKGLHDKISGSHVVKDPRGPLFSRDIWADDDQRAAFSELLLLSSEIKTQSPVWSTITEELNEYAFRARKWKLLIEDLELRLSGPHAQSCDAEILEKWVLRLRRKSVVSNALREARQLVFQELIRAVDPETVENMLRTELIGRTHQASCSVEVNQRTVFATLPVPINNIPTQTIKRRETKKGVVAELVSRPRFEVNRDYKDRVAQRAARAVDLIFNLVPGIERIGITLFDEQTHPTMGHTYRRSVLIAAVDREKWSRILHANVTPENSLRNFHLGFQYNPVTYEIGGPAAVPTDPSANEVGAQIDLKRIDPLKFEALIRNLLSVMGYQAFLTKASHDGGIDVEAFNPEPIVGGKIVVQCKRYASTIGASVVRDLFGTMTDRRAAKGILITTSDFSSDARAFAAGKPLELINGRQLAELLQKYGYDVMGVVKG